MKKRQVMLTVFGIAVLASAVWAGSTTCEEKKPAQKMKPALLVIDIQNAFLPYMSEEDKGIGMYMINAAIELFRENGFPVIRVYHTDPKEGPPPGTEAFEFPETVKIKSDDPKIIKNYPNAFKKTELETWLREKEHNTVFLCGLSAVGCVMATYWSAYDLDFNVFMIKDALISHNSTYTDFVEDICETVTFTALKLLLESAQK
ncbi:MAG: isochorismatase family protein [Candidatus Aminicenantes bacterium]|jgi:nicotinamidase-related amidase